MPVKVYPLGGLGEIGMNCMAIEQRGEVLLVDCGVAFDDRRLGIDVVHPAFGPLDGRDAHVVGLVLTHGHEDHIGAVPYLLRRFDVPVFGPPYALGLVRARLEEHAPPGAPARQSLLEYARLYPTRPRSRFEVGSFDVEPIRVTHSIADATALAITTEAGVFVHSGDFKFDERPTDGEAFDEARLRELGDAGVALLFSDSTNVDAEGCAGSEHDVGEALEPIIRDAPGAVVVAVFASNVHRLRLVGDIARRTGRKVVLLGRSVGTHSRIAHATGYLDWPSDLLWASDRAHELPKSRILGIATGTQGEATAALARLARREHPALDLDADDTVVVSSRVIPGREPDVYAIYGALLRRGVRLRTRVTDRGVHVSGHAHRDDQRRMLTLVRPRAFVPVHGTLHHLTRHAELARALGVPSVEVLENGDVAEVDAEGVRKVERVATGRVHTFAGRAIAPAVLREREVLAEGGVVACLCEVDAAGRALRVDLTVRGVVDAEADAELLASARHDVKSALDGVTAARASNDADLTECVRLALRRAFLRAVGYRPMTVVHIVRRTSAG
jgi:ribonuclease J